jgi:Cys-tRNA(Pro)/Cys-tRNA(Cys) deacylase
VAAVFLCGRVTFLRPPHFCGPVIFFAAVLFSAAVAPIAPKKTNACRALDALGITYELRAYEFDESDLSAETVARKVGMPAESVFKTLCVRAEDHSIVLGVLPGDQVLDLKALARAAGKKAVEPVALKELVGLTGYVRGGVTALACKKPYPVFLDESAQLFEAISISAGQRGLQIFVHPEDYRRATSAEYAPIARSKE